jgi:hypothetical protein
MAKSKAMCSGCYNDFYNRNRKDGCWSFAGARVLLRQRVGTWQPPPYSWHPEKVLSCYRETGYSFLPKSDSRIRTKKEVE